MKKLITIIAAALTITGFSTNAQEPAKDAEQVSVTIGNEQTETGKPKDSKWYDRIKFKADFRYRYEMIDEDGNPVRHRNRVRARLGMFAEVLDELDLGFQLATSFDDPVSTNQTLGGGFSGKAVRFDLAYFDYHPGFIKNLNFLGGKIKTPFYVPVKSEILWDPDLRPEGVAITFDHDFEMVAPFVNLGAFWVEERAAARDTWLIGIQSGAKVEFFDNMLYILPGFGYYNYTSMIGNAPMYDNTDSAGNSVDGSGNLINDYNVLEVFGEIGTNVISIPVSVFGEFIKNIANVAGNDMGYITGFKLGKAKEPLTADLRYNYRKVEADATVGTFSDSDFIGGGTDGKGHEIAIGFQVVKHVKLGLNWFYDEKGIGSGVNFQRLMLDLKLDI